MKNTITINEAVERAWDWIKPHFEHQNVCNESQKALKELFVKHMNDENHYYEMFNS